MIGGVSGLHCPALKSLLAHRKTSNTHRTLTATSRARSTGQLRTVCMPLSEVVDQKSGDSVPFSTGSVSRFCHMYPPGLDAGENRVWVLNHLRHCQEGATQASPVSSTPNKRPILFNYTLLPCQYLRLGGG